MSKRNPTVIRELLPQALQTLEHQTQPSPISTSRAEKWLRASGWQLGGKETDEEKFALDDAFERTVRWMSEWLEGLEPRWIVLVGVSGVGKTMLARRIAEYANKFGPQVFDRTVNAKRALGSELIYSYEQESGAFVKWPDIVPYDNDCSARFVRAKRDWIKVIDDLKPQTGAEVEIEGMTGVQPKRFEVTAAGDLLDARLRKWTVITSNLTRSQLAVFWDVRIASRLTRDGNEIIDLSGVRDYQLRK